MKRLFGLYSMYLIYLLVLGQGCSAIDGVDHIVSVPVPSFENLTSVTMPSIAPVELQEAPEKIEVTSAIEPEIFEKITLRPIKKRTSLDLGKKKAPTKRISPKYMGPIEKAYEVQEGEITPIENSVGEKNDLIRLAEKINVKAIEDTPNELELSYKTGIDHFGFESNSDLKITQWSNAFGEGIEEELIALNNLAPTQLNEDKVTNQQASTVEKSYDPSDPEMLAMFEKEKINIEEIVAQREEESKKEPNLNPSAQADDLVLIDYKEEAATGPSADLTRLAGGPISSAVQNVIKREMDPTDRKVIAQLGQYAPGMRKSIERKAEPRGENFKTANYKNRVTLYALEADLGGGFKGDVTNFNFIPSFDNNEVREDFSEGTLNIDYSLNGETGILRGTLVKNYYIRTTLEIPLGSEYSKFEIPMVTQESLVDYLDKNGLEGAGGFYLVDLGEYLEDVDLEKSSFEKNSVYEHRVLLNEDFKVVKEGKEYRYVLFIGVEPGNINVRYLGINGQETSKITFIAPDELTYDFSQLERPVDLNIETTLQNTLAKKPSALDVLPENIINFLSGEKAIRTSPANYILKTPWKIKGSRSYFELGYLDDSIFVGVDRDTSLELPSREFIGEILRAFQMDGINKECLLQVNMKKPIKDLKVYGESERGPTAYDLSYLDEDGVFSSELSPLSKKLFVLGNEEGIYNIRVKYEDGSDDYLRSYCSPSTYLLEQL